MTHFLKAAMIAAVLVSTGCARNPLSDHALRAGIKSYNAGLYDDAYARWAPLAAIGEPSAQFNIGLLWLEGRATQTPKSADRAAEYFLLAARQGYVRGMLSLAQYQLDHGQRANAVSWLNLAARWNDQNAVIMLSRLGEQVPAADLAIAQQQTAEAQRRANEQAALLFIAGAVVGATTPTPTPHRPTVECRARQMRDSKGNLVYECE